MIRYINSLHFLKDAELDFFYLFLFLRSIGLGLVGVFIPIYLWTLDYPLWQIFGFYVLTSIFYVLALHVLAGVIRGTSHRVLVGASIPFLVAFLYGMTALPDYPVLFFVLPLAMALEKMFFEIAYQSNFAHVADDGQMGRQAGALYVIHGIAGVATPLIGAFVAATFGFSSLFIIAIIVLLVALIPFWALRTAPVSCDLSIGRLWKIILEKTNRRFMTIQVGYGAEYAVHVVGWSLFIFIILNNLKSFGGVIAFGTFATLIVQYFNGHLFDKGRKRAVIISSALGYITTGALRVATALLPVPLFAVGTHVIGKVAQGAVYIPFTQYNVSRVKHDAEPAVFTASILLVWHIARALIGGVLMALAFLLPMHTFFVTAFAIGTVVIFGYLLLLPRRA